MTFLASISSRWTFYVHDAADYFPALTYTGTEGGPSATSDGLAAFRIRRWSAYLFGQASSYEPPKSAPKRSSPSAEGVISLLPGVTLSEAARAQLEQIARLAAAHPGHVLAAETARLPRIQQTCRCRRRSWRSATQSPLPGGRSGAW
ncbi:MAG: hypothetical protein R2856_26805 [Caldilineaceae bacterium]